MQLSPPPPGGSILFDFSGPIAAATEYQTNSPSGHFALNGVQSDGSDAARLFVVPIEPVTYSLTGPSNAPFEGLITNVPTIPRSQQNLIHITCDQTINLDFAVFPAQFAYWNGALAGPPEWPELQPLPAGGVVTGVFTNPVCDSYGSIQFMR